ncbi:MAG TPA: anaerobic nitric oxide reductase flavorubredoxin, partial [Verrucomicrobiae bacterium]|nr:anaerobic nitric oxide reductase flavorubredoxin [Verrucomicrobiae bacterium]
SYNSYLVKGEKNVLIDTVWGPFAKEFIANLKQEIALTDIDYIVVNHAEPDHSGALPELMREIPGTPIYCTANAVKSLKGHYHQDWNFQVVKTGDKLNIGQGDLVFVEAPMLHWPDTMFTYHAGENILFSNDAFGQHYASEGMFNDLVDQAELAEECLRYYANILTPFSKLVEKKIQEVLALGLPVDMICPSHGVIWRQNPTQIVEKYMTWAKDYAENQITIIYDTMWNATRHMAEGIAAGIKQADPSVTVKLFNSARSDHTITIAEVFKSKAVLVGSSTINRGILSSVAGILEEIRGLSFKGKSAAAFGSYGWSGESVKMIQGRLEEAGFALVSDGLKELWDPGAPSLANCVEFGQKFAIATK